MTTRFLGGSLLIALFALTGCTPRPKVAITIPDEADGKSRISLTQMRETTNARGVAEAAKLVRTNTPEVPPTVAVSTTSRPIVTVNIGETTVTTPVRSVSAGSPVMIQALKVRSDKPYPTREAALNDALIMARIEVMKQLQALEPPVEAKPSMVAMKHEYMKKDSLHEIQPDDAVREEWKASKLNSNRIWVELDVELTEDHVQRLRSSDRVTLMLRVAGVFLTIFAAVYGFFRLDDWTKGYLTLWLACIAVGAVAVAVLIAIT